MKNPILSHTIPLLLLAATAFAEGEPKKEIIIRHRMVGAGPNITIRSDREGPAEMEKVAYLGVETMPVDPTVAAQLGLPRGTGIVIRRVAEGSPAAGILQPHDVLTKLDDQMLVNMQQLTVLVRNHKVGDEVKLTLLRGGKEVSAKAKLAEREVPKQAWGGAPGAPGLQFFGQNGPGGGNMFLPHELPGMDGAGPGDAMRALGEDRMHWFAKPRVHVFKRLGGKGSSILDIPSGNFVFSDEAGSVEVNASGGKRELTVKDKKGAVTFQGPITTPEEHDRLPAAVKARLDAIGGAEFDDDADDIHIETKVLNPAQKTKNIMPVPSASEPGMRTL